jgi:hypothetical protein
MGNKSIGCIAPNPAHQIDQQEWLNFIELYQNQEIDPFYTGGGQTRMGSGVLEE